MKEMRKITALVPANIPAAAQNYTGQGVTATLRIALEGLAYRRCYERLEALKGKVTFDDFNLAELRRDRKFDASGNITEQPKRKQGEMR